METKIDEVFGDLDYAIEYLLEAKRKGEHVYCVFNGHELHSDNITVDSAYLKVMGCTKAEYDQREKEWSEKYEKKREERAIREQKYAELVEKSRTEKKPITIELVIKGLKFIAEHRSISQEELINGLLELGCNFSFDDIKQQFPEGYIKANHFDGIKQGDIVSGAVAIVNARDSEYGRAYCDEAFLKVDSDYSIYHFIRIVTGDDTYTKEMVDSLNETKGNHM